MSDSSDDEYEALRKRNLARNKAVLAELGIGSLVNDGKKLLEKTQEIQRKRTPVPTKIILPQRRSARIQKQTYKLKYVKGFRGFLIADCENLLNKTSYINSEDSLASFSKTVDGANTGLQFEDDKQTDMCVKQNKILPPKTIDAKEQQNSQKCVMSRIDSTDSDNICLPSKHISSPMKDKSTGGSCNDTADTLYDKSGLVRSARDTPKLNVVNDTAFQESTNFMFPHLSETEVRNTGDVCKSRRLLNYENSLWQNRDEISCLKLIEKSIKTFKSFKDVESDDDSDDDDWSKFDNIMFCISTSEESDEDGEDEVNHHRKWRQVQRFSYCNKVPAIAPDEVTEDMIENIARRSSLKVYDHVRGTTCHQCRQKTLDTKTVCRSGRCVGVRGMFCGICLLKRYGEKVGEALQNLMWECPVCRGICNCSFCRSRAGKHPTGIMYPQARQQGYKSVAEYLMDNDKENRKHKKKLKVVTSNGKQ